jgi:hypothetical protein
VWLPGERESAIDLEYHFSLLGIFNINTYIGLDTLGPGSLIVKGLYQKEWPVATTGGLTKVIRGWLETTGGDRSYVPDFNSWGDGLPLALAPGLEAAAPMAWMASRLVENFPD